jgi:hypothetical protein
MAYFFGYAKVEEDLENPTAFFSYEKHDPNLLKTYNGFKSQNKSMIEWICTMNEQEATEI